MKQAIVIHGATGRMGEALERVARADSSIEISARIARQARTMADGRATIELDAWNGKGDAVVDFSTPDALARLLDVLLREPRPLVSGTTGLGPREQQGLVALAARAPVLHAANFSCGLACLAAAVEELARRLPSGFECEIVETHHSKKVDAPSGTALALAERVARGRGQRLDDVAIYGRKGRSAARRPEEIAIHALRMGEVVGRHEVHFAGTGETIELTHNASSRDVFARGAMLAARYLNGRPPGTYRLADALGLHRTSKD